MRAPGAARLMLLGTLLGLVAVACSGGVDSTDAPSAAPQAAVEEASAQPASTTTSEPSSGTESPATASESGSDSPPNVVIFMVDDVNPHDGRLWRRGRMPELHENIVSKGIEFTAFHGEVPLCCPAKASILSGQHAHNSGSVSNNGQEFDPATTIATELSDVGYYTTFVGKYLNGYNDFTPDRREPAGWNQFDVISDAWGRYFRYFNYEMTDSEGDATRYGTAPIDYSTDVIANTAVERLRAAPADQPIFAWISTFAPHKPIIPAPRHEDADECANVEPWKPPNYDEEDISDKPEKIRVRERPPVEGYDLVATCETMLSVDEMIGQVSDELERQGRLDDTIMVFMADNGMTWGEHRRIGKTSPYATGVPAFISWPAGRGESRRQEATVLSQIDIAPTICELAGCKMGPYPNGQTAPDGFSFASLLRDAPYPYQRESILHTVPTGTERPVFWSIRTTPDSPLGLWHYVEHREGDLELYDISNGPCYEWVEGEEGDPCEMTNLLAAETTPEIDDLVETLSADLARLKTEVGEPPQPNA